MLTQAAVKQELERTMESYAAKWRQNAAGFAASGDYEWMTKFVEGRPKVLEVGTGDGTATLALLKRGHRVVGLDLNPWCLDLAEAALRAAGYAVERPTRSQAISFSPNGFDVSYSPLTRVVFTGDVSLVLTDVLKDAALPPALEAVAPFDAVCWWCPGAYGYRAGQSDADKKRYRSTMREALCHAGHRLLPPGGVFHVVDRSVAAMPADEHRRSMIEAYSDAARETSLKVVDVQFREATTFSVEGGIPMPHAHLPGGDAGKFVLVSVVLERP